MLFPVSEQLGQFCFLYMRLFSRPVFLNFFSMAAQLNIVQYFIAYKIIYYCEAV